MFLTAATSVTKLIMNFSPYYKPPTVRILDTSSTLKATSMLNMNSPLVPTIRPFEIGVSSIRRCLQLSPPSLVGVYRGSSDTQMVFTPSDEIINSFLHLFQQCRGGLKLMQHN